METRYKRQNQIEGWDAEPIHNAKILVIGAGTVGNEIVKNLVLLGIGQITIVDYDIIEEINLNRSVLFRNEDIGKPKSIVAAKRAGEINPNVEITGLHKDVIYELGSQFYLGFDCVFLGVDNLEARMYVNRYCWFNDIPVINIGIEGLHGNFSLSIPPHDACIECSWHKNDYQKLSEKYSCLKIGLDYIDRKIPMVITTAAVLSGMAVQECVNFLQMKFDSVDKHETKYQNNPKNYIYNVNKEHSLLGFYKKIKENCPGHVLKKTKIEIYDKKFTLDQTITEITQELGDYYNADLVEVYSDKEIVYSSNCKLCGEFQHDRPDFLGKYRRKVCKECQTYYLRPFYASNQLFGDFTLGELSIPKNHLLECRYQNKDEIKEVWIETC